MSVHGGGGGRSGLVPGGLKIFGGSPNFQGGLQLFFLKFFPQNFSWDTPPPPPPETVNARLVRILLECILVLFNLDLTSVINIIHQSEHELVFWLSLSNKNAFQQDCIPSAAVAVSGGGCLPLVLGESAQKACLSNVGVSA